MPTPFLPAGKSIVTQTRGKNNPLRAVFSHFRAAQALTTVPKTAALFLYHCIFRKKNVHVPRAPRPNSRKIALRYLFFTLGLLINSFSIGTVVSALIVGPLVSLFGRVLPGLGRIRALAI